MRKALKVSMALIIGMGLAVGTALPINAAQNSLLSQTAETNSYSGTGEKHAVISSIVKEVFSGDSQQQASAGGCGGNCAACLSRCF